MNFSWSSRADRQASMVSRLSTCGSARGTVHARGRGPEREQDLLGRRMLEQESGEQAVEDVLVQIRS